MARRNSQVASRDVEVRYELPLGSDTVGRHVNADLAEMPPQKVGSDFLASRKQTVFNLRMNSEVPVHAPLILGNFLRDES